MYTFVYTSMNKYFYCNSPTSRNISPPPTAFKFNCLLFIQLGFLPFHCHLQPFYVHLVMPFVRLFVLFPPGGENPKLLRINAKDMVKIYRTVPWLGYDSVGQSIGHTDLGWT